MTKAEAHKKVLKTGHCDPKGPGEWEQPIKRGYLLQCCDCGLIHSMDFRIHNGKIQFRAYRVTKKLKRIIPKERP